MKAQAIRKTTSILSLFLLMFLTVIISKDQIPYLLSIELPKVHSAICITLKLYCGFVQAYHFTFGVPVLNTDFCL